ncbi:glycogen/starch/alpha-glucan phosphorylase [candidate division CSSED10-310 bacterium]|uniref:Alpha-1,4 glucan phosphorylase n=1 Tax=candidate division CSSED10-310 bacterium TaxID=2855610 RepID=A0ABV6YTV6_UNCC1
MGKHNEGQDLKSSLMNHLWYTNCKDMYSATPRDKYTATVFAVRDFIAKKWIETQQAYYEVDAKRVYYLSLEFLLGRLLHNYILNLRLDAEFRAASDVLAIPYDELIELEWDAGLGNGGLGRLAACFLDSMASMSYPGYGYGIRYEYGIFFQKIVDGHQIETPDNWLRYGNAWEFPRPEVLYMVHFHGKVNSIMDRNKKLRMEWADTDSVMAMAYDYPILGYDNNTVNTLRLWSAKSTRDFDFQYFNSGDYVRAVEDKSTSESISKVLYPNDQSLAGKELRLKQQYFFVSATLKDILRRYCKEHKKFNAFPKKVAIQLNDTHPAIAIPELMRLLVDDNDLEWDTAWEVTTKTFSYTNHTILPEALETWSEEIMWHLLPRHLQIIREIDRRFQIQVSFRFPDDPQRKHRLAILSRNGRDVVNMARLAIVGSHTVNGVSELHSDIIKDVVFKDFHEMWPKKFQNVTNGVTPRRWILEANPGLSQLIMEAIGDQWLKNLELLHDLEPFATDTQFQQRFLDIKYQNKIKLRDFVKKTFNLSLDPEIMLDCQVKRFHEYKRQLLNILHAITLYNRLITGQVDPDMVPRTILFAGKSAPGYFICKLIIKLIHSVAAIIHAHPLAREKLQLIFVPNYSVTEAQTIIPAAELSEQVSTAGYEASGTGNMKFALNGALTIGTLDGANIEIREEVGPENFFLFGLQAEEIAALRATYNPMQYLDNNEELTLIMHQLSTGYFSPENKDLFQPIVNVFLGEGDKYFVLADYKDYIQQQETVSETYKDKQLWAKMAILNVARCGKFSSDRAIQTYAEKIWDVQSITARKGGSFDIT